MPCGKCNFCLASKRSDWAFRLANELKTAPTASFLTFTYSDNELPLNAKGYAEVCKADVQLFKKRIRKRQESVIAGLRDHSESFGKIRYYTVAEYGTETKRPHYHSIMFGLHPLVLSQLPDIWSKGHIHVGDVTAASINYVCKYVINRTEDYGERAPPFRSYEPSARYW